MDHRLPECLHLDEVTPAAATVAELWGTVSTLIYYYYYYYSCVGFWAGRERADADCGMHSSWLAFRFVLLGSLLRLLSATAY